MLSIIFLEVLFKTKISERIWKGSRFNSFHCTLVALKCFEFQINSLHECYGQIYLQNKHGYIYSDSLKPTPNPKSSNGFGRRCPVGQRVSLR